MVEVVVQVLVLLEVVVVLVDFYMLPLNQYLLDHSPFKLGVEVLVLLEYIHLRV